MSPIQVINDTIVALGKQYAQYSPHENAVRDAMFIMTVVLPIVGTGLILLIRDGWWKENERLSIQTVGAAWLFTIAVFGTIIYLQHGFTTRTTFIVAIFHEQIEILIDCVLFGLSARKAFTYTWFFGLFMFFLVLVLPSASSAFAVVAVVGGCNDALMPLLFLYGKQYWYALAAASHAASVVMVFVEVVRNIGVVPYNAIILLSVGTHAGFLVIALKNARDKYLDYDGPFVNPLDGVTFKRGTLIKLIAASFATSALVTIFLVFILPRGA